jgi:hypothetical protein
MCIAVYTVLGILQQKVWHFLVVTYHNKVQHFQVSWHTSELQVPVKNIQGFLNMRHMKYYSFFGFS